MNASQELVSLAWWIALFNKIAASDFMRQSAAQKANWLTIDRVLNGQNMMKILEGKYDSERPIIAKIHCKHYGYGHSQTTMQSGTVTETSAETSKEKIPGIPKAAKITGQSV